MKITKDGHVLKRLGIIATLAAASAFAAPPASEEVPVKRAGPVETARARGVEVPSAEPKGPSKQSKVLVDAPELKLLSIRLREGSGLPEHASPHRVLIQAVSGAGEVVVGDRRIPLDRERFVVLDPGVPHAVTQEKGAELVLLVHHLRGGGKERDPHHHD